MRDTLQSNTPITLVHLRSLHLICEARMRINLRGFGSCFKFPALEISSLLGVTDLEEILILIRFMIQRSRCSLKKISLHWHTPHMEPVLVPLLKEMPSLEHLIIRWMGTNTPITHLALRSTHPPLVPMLRTLGISLSLPTSEY
jgi:hypothetical protein